MQAARAYGGPKSEAGQWAMGLVRLLMTRGAPLPLAGPVLSPSSRAFPRAAPPPVAVVARLRAATP